MPRSPRAGSIARRFLHTERQRLPVRSRARESVIWPQDSFDKASRRGPLFHTATRSDTISSCSCCVPPVDDERADKQAPLRRRVTLVGGQQQRPSPALVSSTPTVSLHCLPLLSCSISALYHQEVYAHLVFCARARFLRSLVWSCRSGQTSRNGNQTSTSFGSAERPMFWL